MARGVTEVCGGELTLDTFGKAFFRLFTPSADHTGRGLKRGHSGSPANPLADSSWHGAHMGPSGTKTVVDRHERALQEAMPQHRAVVERKADAAVSKQGSP